MLRLSQHRHTAASKHIHRVVHAPLLPWSSSPAHRGQLLHKKLNCLSDGAVALLALAFEHRQQRCWMRRCVPGTQSLTGCPQAQPLYFQPALAVGCQPLKLGLSAVLPVLLPSIFSQVPQVTPSPHLKRQRPLCFPRQSDATPRAHLETHQRPYRL